MTSTVFFSFTTLVVLVPRVMCSRILLVSRHIHKIREKKDEIVAKFKLIIYVYKKIIRGVLFYCNSYTAFIPIKTNKVDFINKFMYSSDTKNRNS